MDVQNSPGAVLPVMASTIGLSAIRIPALPGRVVVASTMAGGVFFGGIIVAASTWLDQLVATSVTTIAPIMFAIGTILGAGHGALLGYVGRPSGMDRPATIRSLLGGVLLAVPGVLVSLSTAMGIAVSRWSLTSGRPLVLLAVFMTWLVGIAISLWCTIEVGRVLANALQRWPDRRQGVPLALLTFILLAVVFVMLRPEIWFTDLRVSTGGAVLMALGLTLWVAVPVEVALLHMAHRRRGG